MSILSVYTGGGVFRYLQYKSSNRFLNRPPPFRQDNLLSNFLRPPLLHKMHLFSSVSPRLALSWFAVPSLTADQRTVSFPLRGQLTFLIITFVHGEIRKE